MNAPLELLLAQLQSISFRAEVDALSSRRLALECLRRHDLVAELARRVARTRNLSRVLQEMQRLAAIPQEAGTVHEYDATLAACAVAVLRTSPYVRPLLCQVTSNVETMWLGTVLEEKETRPMVHTTPDADRAAVRRLVLADRYAVGSARPLATAEAGCAVGRLEGVAA